MADKEHVAIINPDQPFTAFQNLVWAGIRLRVLHNEFA
jgi:hypothetical protein